MSHAARKRVCGISVHGYDTNRAVQSIRSMEFRIKQVEGLYHGVQRRMISVDNMSKINLLRTKMADF